VPQIVGRKPPGSTSSITCCIHSLSMSCPAIAFEQQPRNTDGAHHSVCGDCRDRGARYRRQVVRGRIAAVVECVIRVVVAAHVVVVIEPRHQTPWAEVTFGSSSLTRNPSVRIHDYSVQFTNASVGQHPLITRTIAPAPVPIVNPSRWRLIENLAMLLLDVRFVQTDLRR
jgi:hypothetical protein